MKVRHIYLYYLRLPALIRLIVIVLIVILIFGSVIHVVEPKNFETVFDGMYWAIVTGATIGYGDMVPKTVGGKMMTVLLILFGTASFTYFFTQLSSQTIKAQDKMQKGTMMYKGKNHIIIVGWNERSKRIINRMIKEKPDIDIVLVDSTIDENPYDNLEIHFIKGDPTSDKTLQNANIEFTSNVIITASSELSEIHADQFSIVALIAVKGLNPDVPCAVEILTEEQFENAKRAGADKIIQSSQLTSDQIYGEL